MMIMGAQSLMNAVDVGDRLTVPILSINVNHNLTLSTFGIYDKVFVVLIVSWAVIVVTSTLIKICAAFVLYCAVFHR